MKKIIIIGGTSGIGRRLAEMYAEKNYKVAVTGRRTELLDSLKAQHPQQIITACFDVTKNENINQLEQLVKELGGPDIIVISAGGGEVSDDLSWELDKWMADVNVNGFVQIANWAFNFFIKQGYGQLAAISSIAAYRGNAAAPAYSAAKAFQSIYLEGLAMKAYRLNKKVAVTCIEPGFVATKMAKANKLFWVVPLDKAARQIINAIEKRKRKAFISRRWQLVAWILKRLPFWLYRRIVK